MLSRAGLVAVVLVLAVPLAAQVPARPTLVYLVRHGETEGNPQRLNAAGRARAQELAAMLREVRLTHVFASHTDRTRQMAEPAAQAARLPVLQLPAPGSRIDGRVVSDATPTAAAARPLADAIKRVPQGSTVLVAGNRENLFAILNDLGVPLCGSAPAGNPPDNCVPCRDSSCWGNWFDRIWIVNLAPGQPVRLVQLHYGASRE